MRIRDLDVTNFRGLESKGEDDKVVSLKQLIFDPQFNVVIGINGIGKTSLLDLIAILLSRILPRITPATSGYLRFDETDFRYGSTSISALIGLDFEGHVSKYTVLDELSPKRNFKEHYDKVPFQKAANQYASRSPMANVSAPIALYYTIDRARYRLPQKLKTIPVGRAAAYQGALKERMVNYRLISDWLRSKKALASESEKEKRILEITETALKRFLPAFGELEAQENPPRLYVKKNGLRLGIEQLSDGERSFVAMVVDMARHLAQANPNLEDPLADGKGIVLIDEIELHLHPMWQRNVIGQLQETFPNIQFITTTHSPFVIQSLHDGQLINFDPESSMEEFSDQSIEDITEFIMGVDMPQKSQRYQDMMTVAEEYFRLLRIEQPQTEAAKQALKTKLDEMTIPFSNDPAYMAFLKLERETFLGGSKDATSK